MLGKHWCEGDGGCKDRFYCGSRSVVTEKVGPYTIMAGNPARVRPEAEMTHPMFKFQIFLSFEIEGGPEWA
jgi:hypothetical protein